jgi:phosphatidylethanolamine-binding protein (PEBP) family uncharacterized protein
MRAISNALTISVLLAALALAGCGDDGSSSTAATPTAHLRRIAITSPAIGSGSEAIPARYTCTGKDISLPLRWKPIPAGTKELLLLMFTLTPVHVTGNAVREAIVPEWAVAGLPPTIRQLAPGRLPSGAILGRNAQGSSSYSICPTTKTRQAYMIALFASPRKLSPHPGFTDEALFAQLSRVKPPYGQLFASYLRA